MRTVVVYVVGLLLAVLQSADAATDRGLSVVVLAEVLGVGQHCLEELQRNNLYLNLLVGIVGERSLVCDFVDARHSEVLDAVEVCEILLTECHPETCALDGRIVLHERLNLLVMEQIALLRSYLRICERLVDFERLGLHPLSVFPVEALLSDLADVDFGVEVGSESLVVVACIAVDDVEILDFVEVMLGGIGGEDACNTGVEATAEDSCQAGIFKALLVSPLPRVLEVSLVLRLVVGGVEIRASASQTCLHDGEVLIGQCEVDDELWLVVVEERLELLYIVGIHLSGLDVRVADSLNDAVALGLCAACDHEIGENVSVLCNLERCNCSDATGADHKYFSHCFLLF